MDHEPHKAQFFFAESDEDSLSMVDNKADFLQNDSSHSQSDHGNDAGLRFTQEDQTELPVFSENIQHDGGIPQQISGNFGNVSNQEICDVPAVLTDSSDSAECNRAAAGCDVEGKVSEGAAGFTEVTACEDAPVEDVEIDVEHSGEVPDTPLSDSSHNVRRVAGHSDIVPGSRALCDISDDEMDQLPRAQPSRELEVNCNSFRNGTTRAIPPESSLLEKGFAYREEFSSISSKRSEPSTSDEYSGMHRRHPRTALGRKREISRSPPAHPSTSPRDDRRTRLENLKKLNFPTKYKMKERIDDVSRALPSPHGPSTPPYDASDSAPRRNVRSFLDEPGSEFLTVNLQRPERDNSVGRNRSPDSSSRKKRRHDDGHDRGDEREKNRSGWPDANERRGIRDDWRLERDDKHQVELDNGLEDLSNNPVELQRRCNIHIALSENQAASVSDDQLLNAVSETLYLLANAQRLCKKREKLYNEMKAMRQGEVDMMKAIHADLPAHLQSVVRIEGDNVFINEAGLGGLQATANAPQLQQFPPCGLAPTTIYMNAIPAPPVVMSPFMVPPGPGMPSLMSGKPSMPGIAPPVPAGLHVPVPESSAITVSVPPPAKSCSPDAEAGVESSVASSFANMPSTFSHPPPPISSGPTPCASSTICPSSPGPAITGLPDFSKPPPTMRPVNGTSNGSLPKSGSSNALPDVAVVPSRSNATPTIASTAVPLSNAPPLNFNVPPPNVAGGSVTARAPYMQPSSFLGPPPGASNPAQAQDFTKTITNMITSALKAPASAGVNAFGARPGMRTFGPGMSLMVGPPPPNVHDNGVSGDVEWTNNRGRYQYRGKSGYGKRQEGDRRGERQHDSTPRSFDSPKQ